MPTTTNHWGVWVDSETPITGVLSKTTKRCALCPPCYPGQGDLDSTGDFLAYTLPDDCFYG